MVQRQNPIATGGMSLRIARPTTQLAAQNNEVSVSKRYGDGERRNFIEAVDTVNA
jgi:hypothetical protein